MTHFLLQTPAGSLVMVIVGATVVGFLVWSAVALAVVAAALALHRIRGARDA